MKIDQIYEKLYEIYGSQHWWPGETPWEIAVGAVLTQNTNWKNVEKAISNLKVLNLLDPGRIMDSEDSLIETAIKASGYYRLKTRRLKNLSLWWLQNVQNNALTVWAGKLDYWRESILSVNGIGKETADSILLYSFNLPTFVVDAYTKRIMARHFGTDPDMDYESLRGIFMKGLPANPRLFNEFHVLFVKLGKESCRKSICHENCPLR